MPRQVICLFYLQRNLMVPIYNHLHGFSYTEYSLHNIHREMEVRRGIDEIALKVEWLIDDDDDHCDDDDDDNDDDDGDGELTKLV